VTSGEGKEARATVHLKLCKTVGQIFRKHRFNGKTNFCYDIFAAGSSSTQKLFIPMKTSFTFKQR
jgi:hypothetical protein